MRALLLSGGQDSIAIAFWHRPDIAITVDYGQIPARAEVTAANAVCDQLGLRHVVVQADCSSIGSGDLRGGAALAIAPCPEWWPFRNQLLITIAGAASLSHGASELLIGTVRTDENHADGTSEFISNIGHLMSQQEGGLRVSAPAIGLTSSELVKASGIPIEILCWAHSCHRSNVPCGVCRGCVKHKNVMYELGLEPF